MTTLCEEFGISRKTGYKIFQVSADRRPRLSDRSRRPYRHANQLPLAVETLIVRLKTDHPTWGAPKIRERLRQLLLRNQRYCYPLTITDYAARYLLA